METLTKSIVSCFFIIMLLFQSCDGFNDNGLIERKTKIGLNQTCTKLYKDRVLIDSFVIDTNNLIQGIRLTIDTIDSVKILTSYINNFKNGTQKAFYLSNSVLEDRVEFRNDTMINDGFFYHKNGKIKTYEFKRPKDGKLMFQRLYDTNGIYLKSFGVGLIQTNVYKDSIREGDKYYAEFILATPPKATSVFMYSDYINDSTSKNYIINTSFKQKKYYNQQFNKSGIYKKNIYWSIEDSVSGNIYKGSQILKIVVLPR